MFITRIMSNKLMNNMHICGFDKPTHKNHWIYQAILNGASIMHIAEKIIELNFGSIDKFDDSYCSSTTCGYFYAFIQYKKSIPVQKVYRDYLTCRGGILGIHYNIETNEMTFVKVTEILDYYGEYDFFEWLEA